MPILRVWCALQHMLSNQGPFGQVPWRHRFGRQADQEEGFGLLLKVTKPIRYNMIYL